MKKILLWVLFFIIILFALHATKVVQFTWVEGKGQCKSTMVGLKVGNKIITKNTLEGFKAGRPYNESGCDDFSDYFY